ncbi:hypothetical protein, partial [Paracoccus liaowanqingii]|uniref:hypothetical protein n=1 Tax=Paracoccus liaowanqingii TaxID=2560053 RepID=UPI00143D832E
QSDEVIDQNSCRNVPVSGDFSQEAFRLSALDRAEVLLSFFLSFLVKWCWIVDGRMPAQLKLYSGAVNDMDKRDADS